MRAWISVTHELPAASVQVLLGVANAFGEGLGSGTIQDFDARTCAQVDLHTEEPGALVLATRADGPDLARRKRIGTDGVLCQNTNDLHLRLQSGLAVGCGLRLWTRITPWNILVGRLNGPECGGRGSGPGGRKHTGTIATGNDAARSDSGPDGRYLSRLRRWVQRPFRQAPWGRIRVTPSCTNIQTTSILARRAGLQSLDRRRVGTVGIPEAGLTGRIESKGRGNWGGAR